MAVCFLFFFSKKNFQVCVCVCNQICNIIIVKSIKSNLWHQTINSLRQSQFSKLFDSVNFLARCGTCDKNSLWLRILLGNCFCL